MASFFKNLFRKEDESQPVPAAPLTNTSLSAGRMPIFQEAGEAPANTFSVVRNGLSASAGGPFSAVSGRHMTAREIAALLPPALLRFDGISPDEPVPLPVAALRESLQAGRPMLKLSQIQEACPELFQRELLAEEDVEITLPLARVKGILDFSAPMNPPSLPSWTDPAHQTFTPPPAQNPFASMQAPPALPSASPFAPASTQGSGPLGNPFARGSGVATSPFAPVAAPPATLASMTKPAASSPFAVAAPPADLRPLPSPAPQPVAASASPFAPATAQTTPATSSPFAVISPAPPASPSAAPAGSPFSLAAGVNPAGGPSASPFAPHPIAPSTFPMTRMEPAVSILPPAPAATGTNQAMKPSPFSPVGAGNQPAALHQAAFPQPSAPAGGSAIPLTWPPPARADTILPLPIAPQPRTSPIPSVRTALVPALSAPLIAAAPPAPAMLPIPASLTNPSSAPPSDPGLQSVSPSGPMVELSLRAVLRDVDAAQLGFVPDNVPESVRVSLPLDLISRQLASGRVEIGPEDLTAGISEKFRPAFARAKDGLRIVVPMSEIFHNLPESAKPALEPAAPTEAHRSITTSPFQTPFAIKAEEDTSRHLLDFSLTGFNPATLPARPSTHPVPAPILPPAPLPLIQPSAGGPPAVQVDLPTLRPVSSPPALPSADSSAPPPLMPRPGLLSRPPGFSTAPTAPPAANGSSAAPTPPKSPPRLKSVPLSPAALRAFPKPAAPSGPDHNPNVPASKIPAPSSFPLPSVAPALSALPASHGFALPPLGSPQDQAVIPPALPPVGESRIMPGTDNPDDLGESFSAAKLSAEPPSRAGSAPVSLLPVETAPLASLAALTATLPVLPGVPEFPGTDLKPPLPPLIAAAPPAILESPATPPPWPSGSLTSSVPVADLAPSPALWPPLLPEPLSPVREALDLTLPSALESRELAPAPATSPLEDLTFGCITDLRQLTLRAVLGTDQFLTPQDIVNCCAALPGLQACVLLQSGGTLTSQGMDETAAAAFCASAAKTRSSLATLAETMGLGTGGNFTLRTDHGIRSFFLETNLCLAVWHAQPQFSGGTREKLILIAQEMAKCQSPYTS